MKFTILYSVLLTSAQAFVVPSSRFVTTRAEKITLWARVDTSKQVEAALEASHKYGPTSPEARIAWETVEEMDASDNRYVYETNIYARM